MCRLTVQKYLICGHDLLQPTQHCMNYFQNLAKHSVKCSKYEQRRGTLARLLNRKPPKPFFCPTHMANEFDTTRVCPSCFASGWRVETGISWRSKNRRAVVEGDEETLCGEEVAEEEEEEGAVSVEGEKVLRGREQAEGLVVPQLVRQRRPVSIVEWCAGDSESIGVSEVLAAGYEAANMDSPLRVHWLGNRSAESDAGSDGTPVPSYQLS